jgi:hypothetical protein
LGGITDNCGMDNSQLTDKHLIIPFASSLDEGCQAAIKNLDLPNLTGFLKRADLTGSLEGDEFDFIPPHERVYSEAVRTELVEVSANTHFDKLSANGAVVLTPCHWLVGIDRISMANPSDVQLTDEESQTLFALMRPYFLEDGIELMYSAPLRWYAMGESLHNISFASLDRVIGRNVDAWQPPATQSKAIRRLQNEMQMLLYTHPINEERTARGLQTVNSFWLSPEVKPTSNSDISLTAPALASDWQAWTAAWTLLDQQIARANSLTLCGERNAHTFSIPATRSFTNKIQRLFKPAPNLQSILTAL